jgi:hypothetical protein
MAALAPNPQQTAINPSPKKMIFDQRGLDDVKLEDMELDDPV